MEINKEVPYYEYTLDDTHCFQVVLKMLLKYFCPDKDYSWKELERITAKVEGLWTWPIATMIWLEENNFDLKVINNFDYKEFSEIGSEYLLRKYGKEVSKAQKEHSDIKQERELAKKLVGSLFIEKRIPAIDDIKTLLNEDYLVICNVNSCKLNGTDGYTGHMVLIKGFNDNSFIFHDPPIKNRLINFDVFERAWAYPNIERKNIIAVKK